MSERAPRPGMGWSARARHVVAAVVLLMLGAATGLGARAYQDWKLRQALEDQRRMGEEAEREQRAAGMALRAGLSGLYRHDRDGALKHLAHAKARDPANGYAYYLVAVALAEDGRLEQASAELDAAARRDWTDYSQVLGLPNDVEMQRERDLLRRGGDDLCGALSTLAAPVALEAYVDLREAGLRLATLQPASVLHLQRGAQLRLAASEAAIRAAKQAGDEAAVRWWTERARLDRNWADLVRRESRGFIGELTQMERFTHDTWVARLRAEEELVATLRERAPE